MFSCPKTLKILGNCFMPICLPQHCLALVYGHPPPRRSLVKGESKVVGQAAECRHDQERVPMFLCPKTLKMLRNCFMPICLPQQCLAFVYGLPPPRRSLVQEVSKVVGQAAESRPQTKNVFSCFRALKLSKFLEIVLCLYVYPSNAWPLCMGSHSVKIPCSGRV